VTEPQPMQSTCDHFFGTHILGGHPLTVRVCNFCRRPDWDDLAEQADVLYRWGRDEALAGKPARERLNAYDMPRQDDDHPSVAELAANDRRWWNGEQAGE
jgi:hypothetical protein